MRACGEAYETDLAGLSHTTIERVLLERVTLERVTPGRLPLRSLEVIAVATDAAFNADNLRHLFPSLKAVVCRDEDGSFVPLHISPLFAHDKVAAALQEVCLTHGMCALAPSIRL